MPRYGEEGARIGVTVYKGPRGAPPLLLLHGFTASSAAWGPNIAELREHFTVITADLLGHGRSDAPEDPDLYTPRAAVDRLTGLLDALGHARVLVCGHSLGGALALRMALDAPERVAGLVVMNSSSAAGDRAWRDRIRESTATMAERLLAEGTGFIKRSRLYAGASPRLPKAARGQLERDFERLAPVGLAGTSIGLTANVNASGRLGELRAPTLVIIGTRDRDFVAAAPAFLAAMPPDLARSFEIEGAGHAANLEEPEIFDEAVVAFAREIGYLGAQTGGGQRVNSTLAVIGSVLMGGGLGLLLAAFLFHEDEGDARARAGGIARAAPTRTATPPRTATAPPPSPTFVAPVAPGVSTPVPEPSAAVTPAPAATPRPAATTRPGDPTPTPEPPEPTPLPSPTPTATTPPAPTATATPAGPRIAFVGPDRVAEGKSVTYRDTSKTDRPPDRRIWTLPGALGAVRDTPEVMFIPPGAGCHTVRLTYFYANPSLVVGTALTLAVGNVTC